jgi:MazG family protein
MELRMTQSAPPAGSINQLLNLMARLRDPVSGCPWDKAQDFATIAPYTIEEAYEVADAIAHADMAGLKDELGDLLFQVVFHARMAEERGEFAFADVVDAIIAKMTRRHPHIFADAVVESAEAQSVAWEAHKAAERASAGGGPARTLDGIPLALPALLRAAKIQKRLARVGFVWPDVQGVLADLREEVAELEAEIGPGEPDLDRIEDELGDVLFVCANLGRFLDIDPEAALRRTNAKVERRFRAVEDLLTAQGRTPEDATLEEMEQLWEAAKAQER